jgi:DNA-binding MarR family transcriptional regulator
MFLLAKDGQSQREPGSHISDPEYQTRRNLDTMANAGLIERRPSPTSNRTTLIFFNVSPQNSGPAAGPISSVER